MTSSIIILYFTPNVPVYDDYSFVIQSCIEFTLAPDLFDRLKLVFASLSSYLFVPFKAILLLDYSLFGQANIIHLILVTHIFNVGILCVLFLLGRRIGVKIASFIPIIILFGIPHFMALSWATYAAHTIGLFFTVLVLYLMIEKGRRAFILGFVAASLAAFSAPGGILALVAPMPVLWYSHSKKRLVIWLIGCILLAAIYYHLNGGLGYDVESAGHTVPWYEYVLNWMLFYGSFGKGVYQDFHAASGFFALVYMLALAFLLFSHRSKLIKKPVLLSMLLLSVLLGFAIMAMRSRLGLGSTTAYRYRLYQAISWVLLYVVLCVVKPYFFKSLAWTLIAVSTFYLVSTFFNIKLLRERSEALISSMEYYNSTGRLDQLFTTDTVRADQVLKEAAELGIYHYRVLNGEEK